MSENRESVEVHRAGEAPGGELEQASQGNSAVDTFGGKIFVRWDPEAAVTAFGPLTYLIEFLKTNGLWQQWVDECPLVYQSPNAPPVGDILGTILLSVLAGHKRYAHVTTIRSDSVTPGLLGMQRVRSSDAVRRAFRKGEAASYERWMQRQLESTYEELLSEPWILDMDATVKPLYGHQERAVQGYNPSKPGRPSHVYQSYFIAAIRMVLEVEVQAGNQTASKHAQPGLWAWLERRPREQWPQLVRGDIAWGTERMMTECEQRDLPYLFKLRQTGNVKRHLETLFERQDWVPAGAGWQGLVSELQLTGWSRKRRVVVLRRRVRESLAPSEKSESSGQEMLFEAAEWLPAGELYEYAVLVTSLAEEVLGIGQLYRDRAEAENIFDELKNQWGWAGFTTHDHQRCQVLARIVALVYNWWSLFTRLAIPNRHTEATTTRPLLLHGIARQTRHGSQTTLTITSSHAQAQRIQGALEAVSQLLQRLRLTAQQLTPMQRWRHLLRFIFRDWLKNRSPDPVLFPLPCIANGRI